MLSQIYSPARSIDTTEIPRKTEQLQEDIKPQSKNPYHQTVRFTSLNNDSLKSPTILNTATNLTDYKVRSPNKSVHFDNLTNIGDPLRKVNTSKSEHTTDVVTMINIDMTEDEDIEIYRHELDVMINEFRHSAYNTLINIRKSIKNKYSVMLQREKNICDNLVRTKERERLMYEQENYRLTEENKNLTFK